MPEIDPVDIFGPIDEGWGYVNLSCVEAGGVLANGIGPPGYLQVLNLLKYTLRFGLHKYSSAERFPGGWVVIASFIRTIETATGWRMLKERILLILKSGVFTDVIVIEEGEPVLVRACGGSKARRLS